MMLTDQPTLTHAGVKSFDVRRLKDFYMRACRLVLSDEGVHPRTGLHYCFLTSDRTKHHQVVLVSGRPASAVETTVFQLSFRVDTLDGVRQAWRRGQELGAAGIRPLNHGNAWSVYMDDPEGNPLEFYCDTPWYVSQPFGEPLDLDKSDAVLFAETEALCRADPTFKPVDQWRAEIQSRIDGQP